MKQVQYTEGSFPVSGLTYPKIDDQKNFRPSYHPCLEDQQVLFSRELIVQLVLISYLHILFQ